MKKKTIPSLQGVRALAFLGIFTLHCKLGVWGAWGVSVFLVLSGFVMTCSYLDRAPEASFRAGLDFSLKRIKKLYPLHILTMLAVALLLALDLRAAFSGWELIWLLVRIAVNILLLQAWVPLRGFYFSLNGVAWYLSVCVFLYLLFPFILRLIKKLRGRRDALLLIAGVYALQFVAARLSGLLAPYAFFLTTCPSGSPISCPSTAPGNSRSAAPWAISSCTGGRSPASPWQARWRGAPCF